MYDGCNAARTRRQREWARRAGPMRRLPRRRQRKKANKVVTANQKSRVPFNHVFLPSPYPWRLLEGNGDSKSKVRDSYERRSAGGKVQFTGAAQSQARSQELKPLLASDSSATLQEGKINAETSKLLQSDKARYETSASCMRCILHTYPTFVLFGLAGKCWSASEQPRQPS
jgi:hypothetical protein